MAERGRRGRTVVASVVVVALLAAAAVALLPPARAAGYPPLPLADDAGFVAALRGAELTPGGSGDLTLTIHDPLAGAIDSVVLTAGIYAFSPFPGNATTPLDIASAPLLSNATISGPQVGVSLPSISPNASREVTLPVAAGATTPTGTFAVRFALAFRSNGVSYNLSSRGWFSPAVWAAGTTGPNGTVAVNLTRLGVSGILPETSVLVDSNGFSELLWGLLGAGIVVVGIGAFLYFRRSNSSSGTRASRDDPTHAPRAFGKRRRSDGD